MTTSPSPSHEALSPGSADGLADKVNQHPDTGADVAGQQEDHVRSHDDDAVDNWHKVAGPIPGAVWLVLLLNMAERFSFYGMTAPFMNYMQNERHDPLHPGALGWGQSRASQVSNVFFIVSMLMPVGASLAADMSLGRFKVLRVTFGFYVVGALLLFVSSLPFASGCAAPLFVVSLVLIAAGVSGVNGLMAAFLGDQLPREGEKKEKEEKEEEVAPPTLFRTTRKGGRVVVDHARTLETIYNMYYWSINVGGLAGLATTELELHVGFWAAYLLPACALSFSAAILFLARRRFTVVDAESTALPNAARVMWLAACGGFSLDKAKASHQEGRHGRRWPWTDDFVDQVGRALSACRIMYAAWPVLWICRGQMGNNLVSQAAQMRSAGVPNDMLYNTNPIVIIVFIPVVDRLLFPWLRRRGLALSAVTRLVCGFLLEALAMAVAAVVQNQIYRSGPCYEYPLTCAASEGGSIPNSASIFLQIPIFALEAFSEILASPAGYEMASTMAPASMKSVLQALFSTTGAVGSSLSIALSPLYRDPYMVWVYASLAVVMGVVTFVFYCIWGRGERDTGRVDNPS